MTPLRFSRRLVQLVAVAAVAALLFSGCLSGPTADQKLGLSEMNADRNAYSIASTKTNSMLQAKAQDWAEKLARENTLYHSKLSDGITGCWRSLGENVGYGSSIARVEDAYMASTVHRANILNNTFNYAAVGVAYNGSRVFTVQVFMRSC